MIYQIKMDFSAQISSADIDIKNHYLPECYKEKIIKRGRASGVVFILTDIFAQREGEARLYLL